MAPEPLAVIASREICDEGLERWANTMLQVETREPMAEQEAIASVDGVDGVFIGPADLSASYGYWGNWSNAEMQDVLQDAARRLSALGKVAGILTANEEEARLFLSWGYRFVAIGADL